MLQLYDFPSAAIHSPQRESTISPLQQLFVMNSSFLQDRAAALVSRVEQEPDANAKLRTMHRRLFGRDPSEHELQLAVRFLENSSLVQYAQALLATNEVIFWP
jgi:hypothetical protein